MQLGNIFRECNSQTSFGNAIWKCILGIQLENAFWTCNSEMHFGNVIRERILEMQLGKVLFYYKVVKNRSYLFIRYVYCTVTVKS